MLRLYLFVTLLCLQVHNKHFLSKPESFKFANFIHFIIHCGTQRICIFLLVNIFPNMSYGLQQTIAHKSEQPALWSCAQGSSLQSFTLDFNRNKSKICFQLCVNLIISEYLGHSYRRKLDFLCESSPTSQNNYTPPLGHNTKKIGQL